MLYCQNDTLQSLTLSHDNPGCNGHGFCMRWGAAELLHQDEKDSCLPAASLGCKYLLGSDAQVFGV